MLSLRILLSNCLLTRKEVSVLQSKLTIILNDGKKLFYHASSVRGTPDNPMDKNDITAKSKRLFKVFNNSKTDDLIDCILNKDFTIKEFVELSNLNIS